MNNTCPMMKQNVGTIDRIIRILIGAVALIAGKSMDAGTIQSIVYTIGFVSLITAMIGYCGLYSILGITTNQKKK